MTVAPQISVCMPVRNGADYVGEALRSALAQRGPELEVVVYDDASTDATAATVAALGDGRIRYERGPRRIGVAAARNACLAAARGDYVAWLDADDVLLDGMLARQAATLDRHARVGLVHGRAEIVDAGGRRLADWPAPFAQDTIRPARDAFCELLLRNVVIAPTTLVRRAAHDDAGPYAPQIGASSTDWDMWLRIARRWDVAYTAAAVARYRQHPASISTATERSGERLAADVRVVRSALRAARGELPPVAAARARTALATKALAHAGDRFTAGRRAGAAAAVLRAIALDPRTLARPDAAALVLATLAGREVANFRLSRRLRARLAARLAGTLAAPDARTTVEDPGWTRTLQAIAASVRATVPRDARIGAIDKWDPTLLAVAGRRGWHFPDRALLPGGYPATSDEAVAHLEALRARGMDYLVVPCSAFWWLEHYDGWREHLERRYARTFADERCVIWELAA